jgi:hypothetical protein
MYATDNDL